jgi:hypothetical protein
MLEPLKRVLRERGLPFHNPYRPKRIDWNPLAPLKRGTSPAERVLAFLKPRDEADGRPWTGEDMRSWTAWVRPHTILLDSAAEIIKRMSPNMCVSEELLHDLLKPHALLAFAELICGDSVEAYIKWWLRHMPVKRKRLAAYPANVATQFGVQALIDQPQIVIGTGHSVKGGEADVVYVFPDLSASGMRQWSGYRHERDALIRLGYVMMTRARETLVLCEPAGSAYMPIAPLAARLASERRDIRHSVQ